jgi:hypothetical protein
MMQRIDSLRLEASLARHQVGPSVYNHELRAVGQAIEAQGFSTFELKVQAGRYVVSGAPERPATWMAALRYWRRRGRTLSYAVNEIKLLEKKGRSRRKANGRLPDFYNVSSILRTVGAYLDVKSARLLEIQKRALTLTLMYQPIGGHLLVEDRTIASFYKLFTDLHGRRSRPDQLTKYT